MEMKLDYSDIKFRENGKLKLLIIVGTRPEIIRLAAVIKKCRKYFDCILAHTGQNYDYNLNGVFFEDLKLDSPEVYMNAVGDDLGATVGNIINCSYKLMKQIKPDALLILGDTNSCLSAIPAKRLHIPIFHMEAGNRCKDECLPEETNRRIVDIISDVNLAYSEHARKYLHECGLPKERVYVTGSPMAEVLSENLKEIEKSDVLKKLSLKKGKYIFNYLQKPINETDGVITCFRDGEVTLRSNRREDGFTISEKEIGYQGIDIGDLIVHGMDGFAGAIGISDSRGKASPVLNNLTTNYSKRYYMYFLRNMAFRGVFLALSTGIRVRTCDTNWGKLREIYYVIPPLSEQEVIANFLDKKCAEIDSIIEDKKKQLEILEDYKKSLIYEYVTGKKEVPNE